IIVVDGVGRDGGDAEKAGLSVETFRLQPGRPEIKLRADALFADAAIAAGGAVLPADPDAGGEIAVLRDESQALAAGKAAPLRPKVHRAARKHGVGDLIGSPWQIDIVVSLVAADDRNVGEAVELVEACREPGQMLHLPMVAEVA